MEKNVSQSSDADGARLKTYADVGDDSEEEEDLEESRPRKKVRKSRESKKV
ncbi:hypothetical protein HDU93_009080 [Gonapodya sp. JEL0774]|nr:hypothetical protein HDU93_009080 [Gonapodya sp. JEL0774]